MSTDHSIQVPIQIRYAHESDLSTLVNVRIRCFPLSKYVHNTYKRCDPLEVQTFKTVSSLEYFAKPDCHILADVDIGSSDIVAYCRWHIPAIYNFQLRDVDTFSTHLSDDRQEQMRCMWDYAPQNLNKGIYSFYEEVIKRSRATHLKENDIVLELLCVLPEYQRNGIGSSFLRWGIEKADAVNARIYLEATMEGVPAYLKYGWKVVDEIQLDYTERGGEGIQRFALMIREPQQKS